MAKPFQGRKGLFIFLAAVLALLLLIYFTSLRENRTPLEDAMLAIFFSGPEGLLFGREKDPVFF